MSCATCSGPDLPLVELIGQSIAESILGAQRKDRWRAVYLRHCTLLLRIIERAVRFSSDSKAETVGSSVILLKWRIFYRRTRSSGQGFRAICTPK